MWGNAAQHVPVSDLKGCGRLKIEGLFVAVITTTTGKKILRKGVQDRNEKKVTALERCVPFMAIS